MGPFDAIGPYGDMAITTRKSDVDEKTDNKPGFRHVLIGLILIFPTLWVVAFIGLFTWANIYVIAPLAVIGLCFWACAYYGTNRSIIDRFRYRTTKAQRLIIERRLSGIKRF